jgi:hypothetical protein
MVVWRSRQRKECLRMLVVGTLHWFSHICASNKSISLCSCTSSTSFVYCLSYTILSAPYPQQMPVRSVPCPWSRSLLTPRRALMLMHYSSTREHGWASITVNDADGGPVHMSFGPVFRRTTRHHASGSRQMAGRSVSSLLTTWNKQVLLWIMFFSKALRPSSAA